MSGNDEYVDVMTSRFVLFTKEFDLNKLTINNIN